MDKNEKEELLELERQLEALRSIKTNTKEEFLRKSKEGSILRAEIDAISKKSMDHYCTTRRTVTGDKPPLPHSSTLSKQVSTLKKTSTVEIENQEIQEIKNQQIHVNRLQQEYDRNMKSYRKFSNKTSPPAKKLSKDLERLAAQLRDEKIKLVEKKSASKTFFQREKLRNRR